MFKNVAAKFRVFAFDATTNVPKTGDAANLTAYVSKDYGAVTVLADTSATEEDATNAPGYYLFDAAQGETNADVLMVSAKSSTANIKVIGAPAVIYTRPTTGWLAPATAGRTLVVDAAGLADANLVKAGPTGSGVAVEAWSATRGLAGTALPAAAAEAAGGLFTRGTGAGQINQAANGQVDVNATHFAGTAYATAVTALVASIWNALTSGLSTVGSIGKRIVDLFSGITSMAQWLGLLGGKQTGDATARTEIRATGAGSGTYDETTDSVQAIRDRGDAAWVTATGFSTLDAAGVRSAVGLGSANLDTQLAAIQADSPNRVTKNTALAGFTFFMRDSTTHLAATGLTVTAQRSIDGAALGACANAVAEVGNGVYKIDLAAADLNGNVIMLRFTATGADDCLIGPIPTQPT